MKTTPIILLALSTITAMAEVPDAITFTNKTGDVISNAHVLGHSAREVFYEVPGGGARVKLADLPASLQRDFNYDPAADAAASAAADARKAARLQAETQTAAANADAMRKLGPPQTIQIVKIVSGWEAQIVAGGVYSQAYVHNLPLSVVNYVKDYGATKTDVMGTRDVDMGEMVTRVNGVRTLSDQALYAINIRRHFRDIAPHLRASTTILARPTQFAVSGGVRQWEYVGTPVVRDYENP